MKEGEGISQRSYMHDPETQTTVWRWPEGRRGESWVEVGKGEKMGTSVSNRKKVKKKKEYTISMNNQFDGIFMVF